MKKKTKEPFVRFCDYDSFSDSYYTQRSFGIHYLAHPKTHWHIIIDFWKWYIEFTFNYRKGKKK